MQRAVFKFKQFKEFKAREGQLTQVSGEKGGSGDSTGKVREEETAVALAGDRAQGPSSRCLIRNLQ